MQEVYLKSKDIMQILGVSINVVYRIINSPNFPVVKFGQKCIRVPENEFYEWMKENIGREVII